jgi:hypothetical protein
MQTKAPRPKTSKIQRGVAVQERSKTPQVLLSNTKYGGSTIASSQQGASSNLRVRVRKPEELGVTDQVATSLASLYGQAVYYTNKNMNIHRKSQSIQNQLQLRKT